MKPLALALSLPFMTQSGTADLSHARTQFHVAVELPYAEAAPLFGAWAEQKWATDWHPKFLYPSPPADQEGAVFKVEHGSHSSIWTTTVFNLPEGHIQYVYLVNQVLITRIDILLRKDGPNKTGVSVTYERTALDPTANEHLKHLAEGDSRAGTEWQAALDAYAAKIRSQ